MARKTRCPRCGDAYMIMDQDRYTASDRLVCLLCGESQWLNFKMRRPSPLEVRRPLSGIARDTKKSFGKGEATV